MGADPSLMGLSDKNSIRPLFVALADHCIQSKDGVLTMINPTIVLCATSGERERRILAATLLHPHSAHWPLATGV